MRAFTMRVSIGGDEGNLHTCQRDTWFPDLRVLVAVLVLTFCGCSFAGFEDRRFETARLSAAREINSILIERKVCSTTAECGTRNILVVSPTTGGFFVLIYELTSEEIIQEIATICARHFFSTQGMTKLSLSVVEGSKDKENRTGIFYYSKVIFSIEYKRGK